MSCDLDLAGDILSFYVSQSSPVEFLLFFFLVLVLEGCFRSTSSSRSSATALDGEYVSTFFLATNKEWFFSGFSYLAWYIIVIFHTLVL